MLDHVAGGGTHFRTGCPAEADRRRGRTDLGRRRGAHIRTLRRGHSRSRGGCGPHAPGDYGRRARKLRVSDVHCWPGWSEAGLPVQGTGLRRRLQYVPDESREGVARVTRRAPGSTVKIMSIALFPPPTPLDQNPAWQAVNKALNADVQFDVVTQADYPVKLGTVMAGNDLPDMIYMYARAGSSRRSPRPQACPSSCSPRRLT